MNWLQMYINLSAVLSVLVFSATIIAIFIATESDAKWLKILTWSICAGLSIALIFCVAMVGLLS